MVKRGSAVILIVVAVVAILGLGLVFTVGTTPRSLTGALFAGELNPDAVFLAADEDAIDNGNKEIERISFGSPFCGGGDPAVCVNDDRPGLGQRSLLVLNDFPGTVFVMTTGEIGDEALFGGALGTSLPDPLVSAQDGVITALSDYFFNPPSIFTYDENELDKVNNVVGFWAAELQALVGKTICLVVYDSDISTTDKNSAGQPIQVSLKGETYGLLALEVISLESPPPGADKTLPPLKVVVVDFENCFGPGPSPEPSPEPDCTECGPGVLPGDPCTAAVGTCVVFPGTGVNCCIPGIPPLPSPGPGGGIVDLCIPGTLGQCTSFVDCLNESPGTSPPLFCISGSGIPTIPSTCCSFCVAGNCSSMLPI